jgi:F-type H+-transporting ATPase subunit b
MRHSRLLLCILVIILTLTWTFGSRIRARGGEDEHGKAGTASKHDHKDGDEGPPIFTPVRIDLAVWTLVVFLLLLFVLTKYAWNPMLGALQKREENVRSAIDEARRARDEAHQIREHLASERAKIADETRAALEAARKDGQQLRETMLSQAKADIQAERDRLHREIDSARDQALKQLWDQTAQLATLISAKAIHRQLTPDDHRRLVDEALADLRNAGEIRVG